MNASAPDLMSYAALIRPVIDRVYAGLRKASAPHVRAVYEQFGLRRGFEISFYFGLLARPMPADAFAATTVYSRSDMTDELSQGTAVVDAEGTWRLTDLGRDVALAVQRAIGDGAEEFWDRKPIATLPGLAVVPRLGFLIGRLLDAGLVTGGPVFRAMVPVYEPEGASPALCLSTRLGALRHHRADAHRAAWAAAGLTAAEIQSLPPGPARQAIEDATNRRDAPLYSALSMDEQRDLFAGLGALQG
jgi:hypothetical protein